MAQEQRPDSEIQTMKSDTNAVATSQEQREAATHWPTVFIATFCGAAAAMQIGKTAAALPFIEAELGIDLKLGSVYLALISLVAALGGFWFGALSGRLFPVRSGLAGLVCIAAGSILGAISLSVPMLIGGRVLEAVGFALVVTAMPSVAQSVVAAHQKSTVMGIWAAWLPAGIAFAMLCSLFLLEEQGWRALYWLCAAICVLAAIALYTVRAHRHTGGSKQDSPPARAMAVLKRQPLAIAAIFLLFSAANLIVMGFLPKFLIDDQGYDPSFALVIAMLAALTLLPGNIGAGWLVDLGISRKALFLIFLTGMAVTAQLILYEPVPDGVKLASIFLFSFSTGVPPSLVWTYIPHLARSGGEAPLLSGLFYQGAGIGQLSGPIIAGWAVQMTGNWSSAGLVIGVAMIIAIALAITVDRVARKPD